MPARVAGGEMEREEAELEAARRNASDERRSRLEFYAFDPSAGLASDAWEVTMRLRRERSEEAVVLAPPAPEIAPSASEPEYHAPGPEVEAAPEPSCVPEPAETESCEVAAPRPVDDWFEPDPEPAPAPHQAPSEPKPEPEPEPATAPTPRRRPRTGRVRRAVASLGAGLRERRDRRRREREELGLEPPTVLERLSLAVGTALITVAVLWIGLILAIAVLLGSTSSTGLGLSAAGVAAGILAAGLGVLIRRA